jgi:serine protease Do
VHGALGVAVSPSPTGVYIADVQPASPAAKVGLEPGSFLLSIGGVEITTPDDLLRALEQLQPQETVKLVAWTDGKTRDMAVVLASNTDARDVVARAADAPRTPARLEMPAVLSGATLVEVDEGVTVVDVAPRSPATELGLRRGDIIRSVAGERISTTTELFEIIDGTEPAAKVEIEVQRGPANLDLVLVMPAETVTVRRPAIVEVPADMPEYARMLLRQQQENEALLDSLLREVQALRTDLRR